MTHTFDGWHLPGLDGTKLELTTYELGDVAVRAPRLSPAQVAAVAAHLADVGGPALRRMPAASIIDAIDQAAARVCADETTRQLVAAATGYAGETVADVLRHMATDWSRASLERLIRSELGSAEVVDGGGPAHSRLAMGPRLAFHVFSGNVPGVAVTSLIRALLVKSPSLGKTASGEPILAVLFARSLAAVAPALGDALAVSYWPGGSRDIEAAAMAAADTVIVYGGEEAIAGVRAGLPGGVRLVEHGPRLSLGLVGPGAGVEAAGAIARATAAYDQQGCVSPHVVYVLAGGVAPVTLAEAVAAELEGLAASLPPRRRSTAETLAIRAARDHAEFGEIGGGAQRVFGTADLGCTVIYDDDATLRASCLNRTLYIKAVADVDALCALLMPHRAVLQSIALAGFSERECIAHASALAAVGITRITTFEQLPWPPMWWHHDGRGPLIELVNWVDIEP